MSEEKLMSIEEAHKHFAVKLNGLTWNLLGKSERTEEDDEKMLNVVHASMFHWLQVGKPVNFQRGDWLIARVYTVLKRTESALFHAERCNERTVELDLKDFDLAYNYEALARANALAGNKEKFEKYYKLAAEAGEKIAGKEDKKWFDQDLQSEPWFGMK